MSSNEPTVRAVGVGKCYELYHKPVHRLWQALSRKHAQFYREFWALRDISFEVRRGECIGILGANGSGKSTLLQLIAGTLALTTGTIDIRGRIAALLELGSGFSPVFTGRENVYMNGAILGFSRREIAERFDAIAAFANIGEFIDQPVKIYSSGMLLRLAFAVQVQVEPDILIVDEALAVGDARFQLKCFNRLEELMARGTTVLFVSHSIEEVKQLCTRAILLHKGQMVMQGDPVKCGMEYYRTLFPKPQVSKAVGASAAAVSGRQAPQGEGPYRYHVDLSKAEHYGKGGVTISRIVVDGVSAPNVFSGDQDILIKVRYDLDYALIRQVMAENRVDPVLQFGIRIDTQKGIVLADVATEPGGQAPQIPLEQLEKQGSTLNLEYRLRLPQLQQGDYFLSPRVAVGQSGMLAPLVEYVHLFALTCSPASVIGGLMRLNYSITQNGEP